MRRNNPRALSLSRFWSRWRKMEAFIEEKGEMYPLRAEDGSVKYFQQWPQVAIANKLAQQLTRLEQEFGLTPSARSRIRIEQHEQVDEFEEFLRSNRA